MKIRFLQTRLVKDGTGTTYAKGEVYDLPQASAEHWLNRGVAEKAGPACKTAKPKIVETTTFSAPETARSVNVPWAEKPSRPANPFTTEDAFGKDAGR